MNQDTRNALKEAANLLKSGNTKSARAIIIEILREEPENVQAWYMLSFSVPRKDKQIYALEQVLTLDPNHEKAKNRLQKLGRAPDTISQDTSSSGIKPEQRESPASPSEPTEDLLTQRLFGGPSNETPQEKTEASDPEPQTTSQPVFIEDEPDSSAETEDTKAEKEPSLIFGLSRRTVILAVAALIFIGLAALVISFQSRIFGLFFSQTGTGGNTSNVQSGNGSGLSGDQNATPTPEFTPTPPPPTPTATLLPTPTPFSFNTSDLQPPGEGTLNEMLNIQDQILTQLSLSQNSPADSYSFTESRLQSFAWDFEKLPGMAANRENLQTFYTIFSMARTTDDYKSFYSNIWIDPNGTIYLPDKNLIALTGFEFNEYQKFSYAQAYVQFIRDALYDFEELSIYPPCDLIHQSCEVNTAVAKGEAAYQAMIWANNNVDEETLANILDTNKKIFFIPVQSPTNLMEQIRLFPYEYGLSFAQAVFESDGQAALSGLYESPPTTTEQILHPEKYLEGEAGAPVNSTDISSLVPDGFAEFFTGPFGEWKSYLLLSYGLEEQTRTTPEIAQAAAAGWGGDFMQIYRNEASETILVGHWTFDTIEDTLEFSDALNNFTANFISGNTIQVGDYPCYQANRTSCLIIKDSDVLWFLTPNRDIMEDLLTNYTYLND